MTGRSIRVLAVGHDAGGCRALRPVVDELRRCGHSVDIVAAGPAIPIWHQEAEGPAAREVDDGIALADARRHLRQARAEVLFSASGLYNQIEHTFRLAARAERLPTVALLDSWLNYGERFERRLAGATVQSWPDVVCVIDALTRDGMLAAGFRPEQLVLTGPPNLEASVRLSRAVSSGERAAWRAEQGLAEEDGVLVFFSDPFYTGPNGQHFKGPGALMGPNGKSLFGYTAVEVLEAVAAELAAACAASGRRWKLIVKPHPAEYPPCLHRVVDGAARAGLDIAICEGGSAARLIAMADAVAGMMTIALLEAALADRPALSVQIGLAESGQEDPCSSNRLGYTVPILSREALRVALRILCAGNHAALRPTPPVPLPVEGATTRVVHAVVAAATQPSRTSA